jgi:hypothetical protein
VIEILSFRDAENLHAFVYANMIRIPTIISQ